MSDGSRLRQYWYKALSDAESQFRQLVASPVAEWKRVATSTDATGNKKGKARASATPEPNDVVVHRYLPRKSGDEIYRLVLDVPTADDSVSLDYWKAVLTTPELRQEWDPAVIDAHLVEQFDITTRVCKTNFTLGWPANPRDAVTISRSFSDATTVIDISTSLPRSADEPAFLRPSPPYVRSNVALFAWCIQLAQPLPQPPPSADPSARRKSISLSTGRLRITCFWQHDLRAMWSVGSSTGMLQQLSTMVIGLFKTVVKRGSRVPRLLGYGNGVSIERIRFQSDREALTIDYSIVPEDEDHGEHSSGLEELRAVREHRRLMRSIECLLPSSDGWDVQVTTQASSIEVESLPWTANATRNISPSSSQSDSLTFRLSHAALLDDHSILKVRVAIEISGPSSGLWLNGVPQPIQEAEDIRSPAVQAMPIFQDVASINTNVTTDSVATTTSGLTNTSSTSTFVRPQPTERTAAAEKSIFARVKRNYIYFSSLLQEPEAKWKRTTEARGVTITQLDSIDPTLVVYRAEATFVGVGLWDLFGAVISPGARYYWDKQYEDASLLEHVNELTELWHFKTKPAWPVVGRDSVVLKTVYKSPTAIHVFAFSADDPHLFPSIPAVDPNVIRTQVDLQGWAIESLSPNTTLLTLLEQSDPKGWTNKASIPTLMINALAGIGEFVIKCGGPPVVTRLAGAKANEMRYDHERLCFRVEYETPGHRQQRKEAETADESTSAAPVVECEIRCDIDGWAPSLDVVVDPPPQTISCLRRHRLSEEGGGLWMTIMHDGVFADDERLLAIVRRAPGKEKGVVMVNGTKVAVDVEELSEQEIKKLARRKRVKPTRIPLDQPPVASVIRRRRAEWEESSSEPEPPPSTNSSWGLSTPRISASPLSRFFTFASQDPTPSSTIPSASKLPLHHALDALSHLQSLHTSLNSTEWIPITGLAGWDKSFPVTKSLIPSISSTIPVHKATKILQGVSADEISSLILDSSCRKRWEPKYFQSETVLERYPGDGKVWFSVSKIPVPVPVPFLGLERGFCGVSLRGRTVKTSEAIYCVSTSVDPYPNGYDKSRYNPSNIPLGTIHLDGWILEMLDPYDTSENYAVPSCRVTRVVCVNFGGNVMGSLNGVLNVGMLKGVLGVESLVSGMGGGVPVTRFPGVGVVLKNPSLGDLESGIWKVKRRDELRSLVSCGFETDGREYTSLISLTMAGRKGNDPPSLRNRSSSAFTLRHSSRSDFLVGELVIDSKLYPDGYSIQLKSLVRQGGSPIPLDSILQGGENSEEDVLPLVYSLHTIPNSALYSSGINATNPTRHLLRLMLPTGQYEVSTVGDPLSGEVQGPPEKPRWLKQLSEEGLQGLVYVVVRPAEKKKKDGVVVVSKGGKREEVGIVDEKESLTSVGRDELMDERINKMDIASKDASTEAPSSAELSPRVIGVSDKFLIIDRGVESTPPAVGDETTEKREEESEEKANSNDGRNEETVENRDETAGAAVSMPVPGGYVRVWTTVIIAVIAFLMGSLVRSLVIPADFVYEGSEKGWREIRRLIEIKYIVGGWDLQIAVVRR